MRTAIQILAILAIAALLAPEVRWASFQATPESACTCPPNACRCPGHHHGSRHGGLCAMADGGRCGVSAPDPFLLSTLSTLIYRPAGHAWHPGMELSTFDSPNPQQLLLLPAHARIPDPPPRSNS